MLNKENNNAYSFPYDSRNFVSIVSIFSSKLKKWVISKISCGRMMPIGVLEWLLAKFSEVVKELIEEGDLSLFKGLDFHANNPEILPLP